MNQPKNEFEVLQQMMSDQIAGAKDPKHEIHQRLRESLKKDAEELALRKAWKRAESIVCHSFDQKTIDACRKDDEERLERLISGKSTFEEEDAVLMMQWRALQKNNQNPK
jgi:hypothetical protein